MKSKLAFATLLLGSATLVACQILLGIDDTDVPAAASSSGAVGTSSSSSSGAPTKCPADPSATARPSAPADSGLGLDVGPNDLLPVFAVHTIDLYRDDPAFGYDVDGYNTTAAAPPRCKTPSGERATDGEGGRDNAAGRILFDRTGSFGVATEQLTKSIQEDIDEGKGTTLLRLEGYNGEANDDRVLIRVASSPGLHRPDPDAGPTYPAWDGTDVWMITVNPKNGGDVWFAQSTVEGYVVNGSLVAQQVKPSAPFTFPLFGRSVAFKRGVLSTKIEGASPGSLRFTSGLIAGEADPLDVYKLLRDIPLLNTRVCRLSTTGFGSVCASLVDNADIPAEGYCNGELPADTACENISLTFGFTAVQAAVVAAPEADAGAADAGGTTAPPCAPFDIAAECTVAP